LIDKLAGAASNGIVGIVAVVAGMTGNAKPSDITAAGVSQFNLFMFYIPIVLLILAALLFYFKVDLTEAKHQKIVAELQKRLKRDQTLKEADSEVN
jgi:lactose/raffinose/galactose permease